MKLGIFAHLVRPDLPLDEFYEQRLQIVEAYDRGGFYSYHTAEHHATPLGLAASPSGFLVPRPAQTAAKGFPSAHSSIRYRSIIRCAWSRKSACSISSAADASISASDEGFRRSPLPISGRTPIIGSRCMSRQ